MLISLIFFGNKNYINATRDLCPSWRISQSHPNLVSPHTQPVTSPLCMSQSKLLQKLSNFLSWSRCLHHHHQPYLFTLLLLSPSLNYLLLSTTTTPTSPSAVKPPRILHLTATPMIGSSERLKGWFRLGNGCRVFELTETRRRRFRRVT